MTRPVTNLEDKRRTDKTAATDRIEIPEPEPGCGVKFRERMWRLFGLIKD